MRIAIAFALAMLVTFIMGGAIAIFGFNYIEHAWGAWGSLQVYIMLAFPLAAVVGAGAV